MTHPTLSVIVAAHNVQGYLRQAVMSVAGGDATEVIIVDDCSTDDTAALADELAETLPGVRVLRPAENVGLGRARNLGLSQAGGEYVLFLDGDDYFAPGALDVIRERCAQTSPDIAQFCYTRLYASGVQTDGTMREPLQGEAPFTAAERPDIYGVLNVAWNKAYRREFLERTGILFPVGYYEDIPWTYPLLALAESIVGIDQPLYVYRQRASGSILRSSSVRHLEIVDQFERLMAVLDEHAVGEPHRSLIFNCAVGNLATLLSSREHRVPPRHRRAFYTSAQRAVRSHAPEGYAPPRSGDKFKLLTWIWRDPYPVYRANLGARRLYRRGRGLAGRVLRFGLGLARQVYHGSWTYSLRRRLSRVDPELVVMDNLWGRSPRLNCLAVAREIARAHPGKRVVWLIARDQADQVPEGFDIAVYHTAKHYKALAQGKYFFSDVNLPHWWRKRRGQVFTALHHGTPLKLMGMEERGQTREWREALLERCANWDYSLVPNAYCAEVWKHSYPVKCETLEYGYPRNDVLVGATTAAVAQARARLGVAETARVLLYMPTFRGDDAGPGQFDIRALVDSLGDDDVLVVRGHYFRPIAAPQPDDRVIDASGVEEVEELYLAADVLITDYSSAMFDFANLRRPIVIFAPDWEAYRAVRGTYFDITVDSPGPVARSTGELVRVIAEAEYDKPEHREAVERFAQIFGQFERGTASRDVVARVIDGVVPDRSGDPRRVPGLRSWNMNRVA